MQHPITSEEDIPRYLVIGDILLSEIKEGKYMVGTKLPSEAQLCQRFGENRYTIRNALDYLVKNGIVHSYQGKGHFVSGQPLEIKYQLTSSVKFSEMMKNLNLKLSATILKKEIITPSTYMQEALNLSSGEEVYRLEIIRYADGTALKYDTTWLPVDLFPNLFQHLNNFHSLTAILEEKYEVRMERVWSTFQAISPTAQKAIHLNISPNANLLHIESLMKDDRDRFVQYTSSKYRGDVCRISIPFI